MPRVQDAIPSLACRAWKRCPNPLLLTSLRFAPESRMVSSIELWNEIAKFYGAAGAAIKTAASVLKMELSQVVNRRHKIVHEGDLQPGTPRIPWPITRHDVDHV